MKIKTRYLAASLATLLLTTSPSLLFAQDNVLKNPELSDFVNKPVFSQATISSDGKYIAGIRHIEGQNLPEGDALVLLNVDTKELKQISFARSDQNLEIVSVSFKGNDRIIFRVQQKVLEVVNRTSSADRSQAKIDDTYFHASRIWAVNIDGTNLINLYDPQKQNKDFPKTLDAGIVDMLESDPDHIILITPGRSGAELTLVNIKNAEAKIIDRGNFNTMDWVVDKNGTPILRHDAEDFGSVHAWSRRPINGKEWIQIAKFRGAEGANSGVDFQGVNSADKPGQAIVLARRDGNDTTGAYIFDANTGEYVKEIGLSSEYDINNIIYDKNTGEAYGYCYLAKRTKCFSEDPAFNSVYRGVDAGFNMNANITISKPSKNSPRALVYTSAPNDMGTVYIYDYKTKALDFIGGTRPEVNPDLLPSEEVFEYESRDGTPLWGYLWLPPGATKDTKNLPFIVLPHGGPEGRDSWGWDPFAQWWATNGYMVLQPNFRGGGGFGRKFVEAGWRQWGQRMQQDVRDGADAVIATGRADKNRICIAGWSYGGYATMTGALIDGDLYKCAVAGAGVSDLISMQDWERFGDKYNRGGGIKSISYQYWNSAIGDPVKDKDMLTKYSAALNADKIKIPLLLIHGEEDRQVPYSQSLEMQEAMKKAGKPVELITLKDEGHQWRPMTIENRSIVLTQSLEFFNKNIGPGYKAK